MLRSCFPIVCLLCGAGCATTFLRGSPKNAQQAYEVAQQDLEDGLYPEAISGFTEVKTKYPYSRYAALADLRIADTHFERGKFAEAVDAYRSFLKYHPSHPEAAYAMFKIGEAYYEQIPSDWWFLPPSAEKDQASTRLAISAYRDLLARYPKARQDADRLEACQKIVADHDSANTPHPDLDECRSMVTKHDLLSKGQARLDECRRKLADHELYVARFYFKRDHFKAAVARAEGLLEDYSDLGLDAAALWIMARSRIALGEPKRARAALQRLTTEFPTSTEAGEATDMLKKLGTDSAAGRPHAPPEGS